MPHVLRVFALTLLLLAGGAYLGLSLVLAARQAAHPGEASSGEAKPEEVGPVDQAQVAAAIRGCADYLVAATGADGGFVYRVNLDPAVRPAARYNLLRHAGAVYALVQFHARQPDTRVRHCALRAAEFLKSRAVAPVPGRDDLLAVWSPPELTGERRPPAAKLGGAGLGLAALASLEQMQPGATSLDELRRLGAFLLFMQKDDGSFYSMYYPTAGGRCDKWTSLYYPGEACLGLVLLYELDPRPEWLAGAVRGLDWLARRRAGQPHVEADHWALIATQRLLAAAGDNHPAVPRRRLLRHAAQVCESILAERPRLPPGSPARGGFAADGRTCPTATRLEGLLAALAFLPDDEGRLRRRIEDAVHPAIRFLLRAQVAGGPSAGGIPRAVLRQPASRSGAASFNRRTGEIRIDYVQHALSALLAYDALTASSQPREP